MLKRKIGKTDMEASVIAFGAWAIGGWLWGGTEEKQSVNAIDAAYDNGINFIDTAPIYGFGVSEEIVGKAIKDKRDKIILATKCGMVWDRAEGDFFFHSDENTVQENESERKVYKYLGPESIRNEIELSLKRLQTDYIDLYQTHWQESTTPIEDTMAELLKLKEEGKIRAIGVSNATVEQMQTYGEIDSDQEKFNLLQQDKKKVGNVEYCANNKVAFLAYSPIAQGLLTGKVTTDRKFAEGDVRLKNKLFNPASIEEVNSFLNELNTLVEKYDSTIGNLIMAYTYSIPGISHLLVGARTVEQSIENSKAGRIELTNEDISIIENTFNNYFGS